MKKLFTRISILLVFLIVIDFFIGLFLDQVLYHSPDGRYYKVNHGLNESTADIVIFGSSRAEENYSPFIFEDSLNLSCWNAGRGGQSLPFWYAMSLGVLNRYTPKIVIINIDSYFLSLDMTDAYERTGMLRPFYYTNQEIRPVINRISPNEKYLLRSKIYAYNSSFYYLFRPYLIKGIDGQRDDKGWKPRNGIINGGPKESIVVNTTDPLNKNTVFLFEEFIENFTSKGCLVVLVVSPDYNTFLETTSTIEYVQKMENVVFFNYGRDRYISENDSFYTDPFHLNANGAIEFSRKLSSEIRKQKIINEEFFATNP